MSTENYSDPGGDFADEDFGDEVEPGTHDDAVEALQTYITGQVNATVGEHRAVEQFMEANPGLDVEKLGETVRERAAAIGAPELEQNVGYWLQVAESEGAARSQDDFASAEEFFDQHVLGSQHAGSKVLDF